jgi:uncharacterized protein
MSTDMARASTALPPRRVARTPRAPQRLLPCIAGGPADALLSHPMSDTEEPPYLTYSRYLRERHGCTVYRVAVDAGFSCPNRRGGRDGAGCTYCSEDGARAPYLNAPAPEALERCASALRAQVYEARRFLGRRYGAEAFILFFQAFSGTNAPVEVLRRVYDAGLSCGDFCGLNIATRPDCIDAEKADLIASYAAQGLEVWVELGLQTANDETLARVHRGHTVEQFAVAFGLLRERGVRVAAHLILGLPGEGAAEIARTARFLGSLGIDGVKLHNLHVPAGTVLAREYAQGEFVPPGPDRHIDYLIAVIERLPPTTVIMRLLCETPEERLLAPRAFPEKQAFTSRLAETMRARGARQGRLSGTSA